MRGWITDVRVALRGLRRTPGFTAGAVLVLALGLGVNVAVFTVVNAALFSGFPGIADHDRLVYLTAGRGCCLSYQDLADWRAATTTLTRLAAVADVRAAVEANGLAETTTVTEVTANTFALLGVRPAIGRDFSDADDRPGAARVALLSDGYWRRRFGASVEAIGGTIRINGETAVVVGVMPAGLTFPQSQDLWVPLGPRASGRARDDRSLWFAVGRLRDGASRDHAHAELEAIGRRLAAEHPATNATARPQVHTFSGFFLGADATRAYGALWAAVGVLLAIAGANLASLLVTRGAGRARQVAMQIALGASPARLVRQQLAESLVLSSVGALAGSVVALALVRTYQAWAVPATQAWAAQLLPFTLDARVVAYACVVTVVTGVVVGVLPARGWSTMDVLSQVRDGGRGSAGSRRQRRALGTMVAVQTALAVVLLSGAGLLLRTVRTIDGRSLGYDPSQVVVTLTRLPADRYPDPSAWTRFHERVVAALDEHPAVEAVALGDAVVGAPRVGVELEGGPVTSPSERPQVRALAISPGYLQALGARVVAGRDFDPLDGTDERPVALVNRQFAERYFGRDDILGRRIRVNSGASPETWLTIVGLAPDLRHGDRVQPDLEPAAYVPLRWRPSASVWLVARVVGPPRALLPSVRDIVQRADPGVPVWLGPFALTDWLATSSWQRGVNAGLLTVVSGLAAMLAGVGVFGVVASHVAGRTHEIGVRVMLGAQPRDVMWLVARHGIAPAVAGVVTGLGLAMLTNQVLRTQLVDVTTWDPATLGAAAGIMVLVACVGCVAPARRALRGDPAAAVRAE